MLLSVIKFNVSPASVESWPGIVQEFTDAVRREPGSLFFEWSKSLDSPTEFVLLEAYTDEGAAVHEQSEHFKRGLETMGPHLLPERKVISRRIEGSGWDTMGETPTD